MEGNKYFSKLVVVLILLLVVVTGGVLIYTRNNNALYAKTYAQELADSYKGLQETFFLSISSVSQFKNDLAVSVGEALTSSKQASFLLYDSDTNAPIITQQNVVALEKQQAAVAETISVLQSKPAPSGGEDLKRTYIALLQADKQLGDTILALDRAQLFFQSIYTPSLQSAITSLDPFILDPQTFTSGHYATVSPALETLKSESDTALFTVKQFSPDSRLNFVKEYYSLILEKNSTYSSSLLAAIDQKNTQEAQTILGDYHEERYTAFTDYKKGFATFLDAEILERHGIPEVIAKEKEFDAALDSFIKVNNLTISTPKESISDALKEYLVRTTQKTPSDVITERRDTYLVGDNAYQATFTALFNEGDFDFEVISPNGKHFTRQNVKDYSAIYSVFEKTYSIIRVNLPLLEYGTWTLIAKGPENLDVSLDGSSLGDEIFVEVQRYPETPKLNEKVLFVGTVHQPELVKDAKIYMRVGSYSGYDDKGVVLLQHVTKFPELEAQVEKVVKPGTDMDAVYVAIFDNTKQYGTYCFDGKAQWIYKNGEPIERIILTGDGCTIISPEKE